MTAIPIREQLAAYLREQAAKRSNPAAQHRDDASSTKAAEQLRFVAEYVQGLPDDDPQLRALAAVHSQRGGDDAYVPGENARTLLAGFPLPHETSKPERFLADLLAAEVGDEIDSVREENR